MSKHLGGVSAGVLAGVFIAGIVVGVNWAEWGEGYGFLWRSGQGGIRFLTSNLRKDKSERLGLIVITEQNQYQICSLDNAYFHVELRRKS